MKVFIDRELSKTTTNFPTILGLQDSDIDAIHKVLAEIGSEVIEEATFGVTDESPEAAEKKYTLLDVAEDLQSQLSDAQLLLIVTSLLVKDIEEQYAEASKEISTKKLEKALGAAIKEVMQEVEAEEEKETIGE